MTDDSKNSNGVSEALILAVIPAVAYGMAYLYEFAYCKAFKIPSEFISVSSTTVLAVSVGLLTSLLFVFWIANVVVGVLYPELLGTAVGRAIFGTLVEALLVICVLYLTRPSGSFWYFIGFLLIIGFVNFVFPLITNRKRKGFTSKLEGQEEIENKVNLLSDHVLRALPLKLRLVVLLSAICLGGAYLLGNGDASNQQDFLIPISQPDKVVLRRYGDVLILGKFDRKSKMVVPEFTFIVTAGGDIANATSFRRETVGPLETRKNG